MRQELRPLAVVLLAAALAFFPEGLMADTRALDRPEIAARLFHPRPDRAPAGSGEDAMVAAPDGVALHVRLHLADKAFPTLLLFHGNGEIASDYDALAPQFAGIGLNLAVAEFRGYGRSQGVPQAATLNSDALTAFDCVKARLAQAQASPRILVMGRSLGSACALALAALRPQEIGGLVIESGFAGTLALLGVLGVDAGRYGITEADGFGNLAHIGRYAGPTLIIHGAADDLIDPSEARRLFAASPARDKELLLIPGAGHNDLFLVGRRRYLEALSRLPARDPGQGQGTRAPSLP